MLTCHRQREEEAPLGASLGPDSRVPPSGDWKSDSRILWPSFCSAVCWGLQVRAQRGALTSGSMQLRPQVRPVSPVTAAAVPTPWVSSLALEDSGEGVAAAASLGPQGSLSQG